MLARWSDYRGSLSRIDDLVTAGDAVLLETNGGYPKKYSAKASVLTPILTDIDHTAEVRHYKAGVQQRDFYVWRNRALGQYLTIFRDEGPCAPRRHSV